MLPHARAVAGRRIGAERLHAHGQRPVIDLHDRVSPEIQEMVPGDCQCLGTLLKRAPRAPRRRPEVARH
ncbi:protein of unknown function [Aminobacter niigataensis]|nr:protein of unknown function [Aminobacter niigataensis]